MTTLAALYFLGGAMDDSVDDRLKEVVPRDAIVREIEAVREKLVEMRKHPKSSSEREAIFRQLLQLDLCDTILHDVHIIW
jgi:hypothetical protein